jgi:hypothetical protein
MNTSQKLDHQAVDSFASVIPFPLPPVSNDRNELAPTAHTTSHEGSTTSQLTLWQPTEPQFTKAIADYYSVSRKTVQEWALKIREACPWFTEADLKSPHERHTPLAIELMGNYKLSGLKFEAWKTQTWKNNAELIEAWKTSQQQQDQPQTSESSTSGNLATFKIQQSTQQIQPLYQINIQNLQVTNAASDTSHLQTEKQQLDHLSLQLAELIGTQLKAEGKAGVEQVRAEIQHTVSAVKAQTLYGMLEELQQGKPQVETAPDSPS